MALTKFSRHLQPNFKGAKSADIGQAPFSGFYLGGHLSYVTCLALDYWGHCRTQANKGQRTFPWPDQKTFVGEKDCTSPKNVCVGG